MKRSFISIVFLSLLIMLFVSCTQNQSQVDSPDTVVSHFLKALQQQNYASAKTYYAENLDNMANFRNQIEEISPSVANKLFSKMADFSYTVNEVTFDGATSDDVIKKVEEVIVKDIESSEQTFVRDVTVSLTKENDTWKLDKISDNPDLLNVLSGNIIDTINQLSASLTSK